MPSGADGADGAGGAGGAPGDAGISVVIPTLGRPSLTVLLDALAKSLDAAGPAGVAGPVEVILIDDRPGRRRTEPLAIPAALVPLTKVITGRAAGPAAARNTGWRAASRPWVAFLDDDVVPAADWFARLRADLAVPPSVVGVQGIIEVPLPADRRPTDWERVTAGLADGRWITADLAYRRGALIAVGGFDERFPRAFREDAEVAWRLRHAGGSLRVGTRRVTHPVRPESGWVSVRTQRGNADDALLRRLYGPDWRTVLEVPPGRRRRHALVAGAGLLAVAAVVAHAVAGRTGPGGVRGVPASGLAASGPARSGLARSGLAASGLARSGLGASGVARSGLAARGLAGRRSGRRPEWRPGWRWVAGLAGAVWLAGTVEFAVARIAPGPRTPAEVTRMVGTSLVIPPLAVTHWLRGWWRHRHARPWATPPP